MNPHIEEISQISTDQSVVCILGTDDLPEDLVLNKTEKDYVKRCLVDKEEIIFVNSYFKISLIIREKSDLPLNLMHEELRKVSSKVRDYLRIHKKLDLAITSHKASGGSVYAFTEGLALSLYKFVKYKKESKEDSFTIYPEKIKMHGSFEPGDVEWLSGILEAVYFARDLVNEPLSHLNSEEFARRIKKMGDLAGFKTETYNKGKIKSLKMGGLLGVNSGSVDPPTFSILEWKPEKYINKKPIVLIGKGVVFDSGGLNLKPTDYIKDMKSDMAGGAAVAAVLYAISSARLPVYVIALIPATDNRPGVNACAPGDILTMYNGKTVEVLNTDAEGRLILADALSYAENYDPALVITVATLTGSAASAFSDLAGVIMGNAEREIFENLKDTGDEIFERLAEMPFWDEYSEQLKSDIADVKNIGGKYAGAITAGKFLENFTNSPFIHLDIAGPAMNTKEDFYKPVGGTGWGVRLLASYIRKIASGEKKI